MEFFSQLADFFRPLWGVWLMVLFSAIIAWVMWPSKKRRADMEAHAQIPLRDED
ncbi:cbb3-type cytochrome c oxidase subunit 3 [Thalassospira sp. MA62]|nr:cbb3-type cytochrome c oxidase subunit 3 [Thalassospira sp. MA62]